MKPFDDPEASRPNLPADALAFVADCEAVAIAADWPDMLRLIAIVREQGALLETALVAADVAATALEMCAAENDSLRNSRIALEEQAWRISEERDALRERLDGKTAEWMRAQSAFDAEKESHRRTISELGLVRDRLAKLEAAATAVSAHWRKTDCECRECVDFPRFNELVDDLAKLVP